MLDMKTALGRTLQEIAETHGFSGAEELVEAANHEGRPMEDFPWMGFGSDLESVIGANEEERESVVKALAQTWGCKKGGGGTVFPVGSWERPDPAGIVRRG